MAETITVDQIIDRRRIMAIPGTQGNPGAQGIQGLPGVNAVPADQAVAGYVSGGSSNTNAALLGEPTLLRRSRTHVLIAAVDSTPHDKAIADYVCDGLNDEAELRQALSAAIESNAPLLVCNGGYWLDSWDDYGYMLQLPADRQASVDIRGFGYPYRKISGGTYELTGSVLHVSDHAYDAMPDNATVVGLRQRGVYPGCNFHISGIGIDYPDNTKPAVGINGMGASSFAASLCSVSVRKPNTLSTPESVIGFTGIRSIQVSSYGSDNLVDRCVVFLHRVAFDIEGEHMICYQCTARHCNYSYGIGITANGSRGWHGCELVQCAQELCLNNMLIKSASTSPTPPVTIIDMTGEITSKGNWAFQSVGHVDDSGMTWPVSVDATYSWASVDSNQVTLSYDLFDNASAYRNIRSRLSTYPRTLLYATYDNLLDASWTIFPGQSRQRLPLPPLGQQVNVMLNNSQELISNATGNFFKLAVAGKLSGMTASGAVRTYEVLCSAGDGQPIFKADAADIAAGRDLTYPYAPRNPHSTPAI
ncbi:hypothetical protein [Bifidobacterium tibiigranuli]|uniref:Uncharacterized protein n=1 Tax=Bifidobacterium tibiigranuli TaxID=2172043 RepID=A0A5N6RY93_9BIFI|nr:hypothetical protein [Bifidobacterium tibiigranuli]KAE8127285.1 hypothetical protein DDF78_08665 [Bifidobacterium tibiigranuli]KAE8129676.1 hypothetical protein DDE84_02445 [Bifidobacterium tibiigranuli]